jgi:transposase InsO family protein
VRLEKRGPGRRSFTLRGRFDAVSLPAAIDFTTVEVWTKRGLVTYYLLFAMRLATRQICFLGCTPNPVGSWVTQMARNLTDAFDGILRAPVRYVLLDRDTKFTAEFQAILKAADVDPLLLPPQSPNCNAHLERFFRALKEEALARIIPFSETSLRKTEMDPIYWTKKGLVGVIFLSPLPVPWGEKGPAAAQFA